MNQEQRNQRYSERYFKDEIQYWYSRGLNSCDRFEHQYCEDISNAFQKLFEYLKERQTLE